MALPPSAAEARLRALAVQLSPSGTPEAADDMAAALLAEWAAGPSGVALELPALADLESALAVNRAMAASPLAAKVGGHIGWKMGWKGAFPERPTLCGPLFGVGLLTSGARVSLSAMRSFSAEAEFFIVLGSALAPRSELYSETEVWGAVETVGICIELCGARQFASSDRLHYVADALLGCAVIRGAVIAAAAEIDPASLLTAKVTLSVGGNKISSGYATNNPVDSPLGSITALANELCVERGITLAAGHTVICGHCCQAAFTGTPAPNMAENRTPNPEWGAAAWSPGDVLRAEFEGLGAVEAFLLG